ncbi:MAG: dCTP deaminase [Mucispirillum sp.]|nr:dCTP deaminase [Mucispirillum sp.]
MFLATDELRKILDNNDMMILKNNIRGASIDLRINHIAYTRIDENPLILAEGCDDPEELLKGRTKEIDLAKGFLLKPGDYLYGKTFEKIKVPDSMCGLIMPRSTFARIGLILPISQFANPGYEGNLPLIIHNASRVEVEIPPYYRVAQIMFADLRGNAVPYGSQKDAKYQHEASGANASLNDEELNNAIRFLKEEDVRG